MTSPDPTSTRPRPPKAKSTPSQSGPAAPPPLFSHPSHPPDRPIPLESPYDGEVPFESASLPPGLDEMPPDPSAKSGSSPEFSAADRRALKETLRRALDTFGRMLNRLATIDELEAGSGLYLLDEDDAEGIADPAAAIIGRRGGLGAAASPDINDAIRAAIALAAYVARQLSLRRDIRRARAAGLPTDETEAAAA